MIYQLYRTVRLRALTIHQQFCCRCLLYVTNTKCIHDLTHHVSIQSFNVWTITYNVLMKHHVQLCSRCLNYNIIPTTRPSKSTSGNIAHN